MPHGRIIALGVLCLVLDAPARAQSAETQPTKRECIDAHASAQRDRAGHLLLASLAALETCAGSGCPEPLRGECVGWLGEVRDAVPTLQLEAREGDRVLAEVRVYDGERALAVKLDGQPVRVDPGEHALRFVTTDGRERVVRIVAREGNKDILALAVFAPAAAPAGARAAAPVATAASDPKPRFESMPMPPPPSAERSGPRSLHGATYVVGGVAAVSFLVSGYFALSGLSKQRDLEEHCAPRCDPGEVDAMHQRYVAADVSLAIGLVTAGAAAWLGWRDLSETSSASGRHRAPSRFFADLVR